jgi:hypothetical protein
MEGLYEDIDIINKLYRSILKSLANFLPEYTDNPLERYKIITILLKEGKLCYNGKLDFIVNYKFISLSGIHKEGIYLMYGVACCRHVNGFVNDVLNELGYDSKLQYFFVSDSGDWKRLPKASSANHVAISLQVGNNNYLLDAYNNYAFLVNEDWSLCMINMEDNKYISKLEYTDNNIHSVGKILCKYYKLQDRNISFIYDYNY